VHTRAGEDQTIHLSPKTHFILVVPAQLTDVKPGSFIGVAALPGEGNELKAMEVHIFPEAMRGTGEGFRPFDLGPKSSMTNGNISARVDATTGPKLTVTYKGGEQTIVVDPKTPIVAFEPGAQTDLKPGAVVGTSSVRRRAQLGMYRPDLRTERVRGNVNTRLKKLDDPDGPYEALILARAGLRRIGMAERALALKLLGFGAVLTGVGETAEPHRLCTYLFDVASLFTTFYEECPVLKAEPASLRASRLALCALTLDVLTLGLTLLGVPIPERM